MRAARPASAHRLTFVALLVAAALASAAPARAESGTADDFIEAADPDVKAALLADGGLAARNALATLLETGVIPREHLAGALSHSNFARHARDTIVALAQVQKVPGAKETFEKISEMQDEGGIRGAAFEIQVGAALGSRLASLSATVDGDEVDAILTDGTRVEVKNDAPDDEPTLSPSLYSKAKKQLKLRGRYGDPVMLVVNEPLSQGQADSFRQALGKTARVLVLDNGTLTTQLDALPETHMERTMRQARASMRPIDQARVRASRVTMRTVRAMRHARRTRALRSRRAAK